MSENDDQRNEQKEVETSRRDFLKGSAVAASAGLAATALGGASTASATSSSSTLALKEDTTLKR